MKKLKSFFILRTLVLFLFASIIIGALNNTFAAERKVNLTLKSDSTKVAVGKEFEVTVGISNLENIEEGLVAVLGTLDYDEKVLEIANKDVITEKNGWNFDYEKGSDIKFVADNEVVNKSGEIFSIKFKVISNKNANSTQIKINDFSASGGNGIIIADNKSLTVNVIDAIPSFKDVKKNDWYYQAAEFCNENKIITGYKDGSFSPADKLTRGMMVSILYKMEGQPKVTGKAKFSDVKSSEYFYNAVIWASNNNIVSGYKSGKFGPNDNITREDLAVILYKYAKYKGKNVTQTDDLKSFTDASKVSSYALPQIKWAVGTGVVTGNVKNNVKTLNPKGTATRAEAAAMMEKYCKRVGK